MASHFNAFQVKIVNVGKKCIKFVAKLANFAENDGKNDHASNGERKKINFKLIYVLMFEPIIIYWQFCWMGQKVSFRIVLGKIRPENIERAKKTS